MTTTSIEREIKRATEIRDSKVVCSKEWYLADNWVIDLKSWLTDRKEMEDKQKKKCDICMNKTYKHDEVMVSKHGKHPLHDKCESCIEIGQEEQKSRIEELEKQKLMKVDKSFCKVCAHAEKIASLEAEINEEKQHREYFAGQVRILEASNKKCDEAFTQLNEAYEKLEVELGTALHDLAKAEAENERLKKAKTYHPCKVCHLPMFLWKKGDDETCYSCRKLFSMKHDEVMKGTYQTEFTEGMHRQALGFAYMHAKEEQDKLKESLTKEDAEGIKRKVFGILQAEKIRSKAEVDDIFVLPETHKHEMDLLERLRQRFEEAFKRKGVKV